MKLKNTVSRFTANAVRGESSQLFVELTGRIGLEETDLLLAELTRLGSGEIPATVAVDLGKIGYLDSAGALALIRWEQKWADKGVPLTLLRVPQPFQGILGLIDRRGMTKQPLRGEQPPPSLLERIGGAGLAVYQDFQALMTFLGDLLVALTRLAVDPRKIRWGEMFFYVRRTGAEGLPIVALISLLIGLIIAFMSSLQLKQFGANVYVASLVAVAIVRELGPIMTAILVAGRSASAYAAEIGTMKVNEEVDALVTMGFDPISFLAVPKLLATILVLPLLTLYADLFGIVGGAIVGVVGLDLTVQTFFLTSRRSITLFYLLSSLVKAAVFAFVIAWIGCQRGFQVRGGVEAVGAATTSAVVTSILLIVVVDSAFAVALHYVQ